MLFGITTKGRVNTLSTHGTVWKELPYVGQDFKKITALPHFLWALGGDHQIYIYVHNLDIPIRIREEAYENERWLPIEGFSSRLLPTDRNHFTNDNGTVDRSFNNIRLPSMAWQWESDWQLELTLNGQPLDHDGWTYALDFPAQYHPKKQWSSCVRRRLWVRSRRYNAVNMWCAVAPLHKDATKEPFIDISIGGQMITGADPGTMLVWAVTAYNRVMYRNDVTTKSPEGSRWTQVPVNPGSEVTQLNVGPTGLVWATLLDGRALVRIGVTRECLHGNSWVEVRGPGNNLRITQISVGINSVWVVTQDHQVWFRKSIQGEACGLTEENATGNGWVEMVGRMIQISVTSNDQVLAIGADDRLIYYRTGIQSPDLTGKRWKALHAPLQASRSSSRTSSTRSSTVSLNQRGESRSLISESLVRPSSMCETTATSEWNKNECQPTSLPVGDLNAKFEIQGRSNKTWNVGSVVGTEVCVDSDESIFSNNRESDLFGDDEELGWGELETPWAWVEAGACLFLPNNLPNWFAEPPTLGYSEQQESWRLKILDDLKLRVPENDSFTNYELAVTTSSWKNSGEARVNFGNGIYVDCVLELEWIDSNGALMILNSEGACTLDSFSISHVVCVQCCSEPGNPRLSIHLPRHKHPIVKFQFSTDALLDEWQSHLYRVCEKVHKTTEKPSDESIWALTNLGDIFLWDPTQLESNQLREDEFYTQKYNLSGKPSPIKVATHVGCHPGSTITLTGSIADNAERIGIDLEARPTYKMKHKSHNELENICLHIGVRFGENCVVRNTMKIGKWGDEEMNGEIPFVKGADFKLEIKTTDDGFEIFVDDKQFCAYRHRMPPESVSFVNIWGKVQISRLSIKSPTVVIDPLNLYWKQVGGHLKTIENCGLGIIWGIGFDHKPWVYTGGYGGGFLDNHNSSNVFPMTDTREYRVYENQRWNPLMGYTSTGLPTDRHMWSDITGRKKRTRDQVKLLSSRWQWVSDWLVDYHVPGGVDRDGWQYAVDFPATYHANKNFTDYVRRRRWYRKCSIVVNAPFQGLGQSQLLDLSGASVWDDMESVVALWAIAHDGQPMLRLNVTRSNPMGTEWQHVSSDQPLLSISVRPFNKVWAINKKGYAYIRAFITDDCIEGTKWIGVEAPKGAHLTQISVSDLGVWTIDNEGRIFVRKEITESCPQGVSWEAVVPDPIILNSAPHTKGFKHVSVAKNEVWAVTDAGVMLRREGISKENPAGTGWDLGINGQWHNISINSFN